eukprot:g3997.t1
MTSVKILTKPQVSELIKNASIPYTLVDVREQYEVDAGAIPSSKHIPLGNISDFLNCPSTDFSKIYGFERPTSENLLVFYCRSGVRSQRAAEAAVSAGFKNVANYKGSWLDWSSQ